MNRNSAHRHRTPPLALALTALWLGVATPAPAAPAPTLPLPESLADTGLFADFAARTPAEGVLPFAPQYPLWTDGAVKRRWIRLPEGTAIDASDPDAWNFPAGTRLWKEFALDGRPVETRLLERLADGRWRFAAYAWNATATAATLAPARGVRGAAESAPGVPYDIPGTADCRACHDGHPATVLGFSALQLSSDRDPLAPHAAPLAGSLDLDALVARGLVVGLPPALAARPPRVRADSPVARAALGYLHGNCSPCHNARGPLADLGLSLTVRADGTPEALAAAVGRTARYRPSGAPPATLLVPGDPGASLLLRRLASREPLLQMPPLGSHLADVGAVALVREWIRSELDRPALGRRSESELAASIAAPPKEREP